MKAKELMIGDLVRTAKDVCFCKGTIVQVRSIDGDNRFLEKDLIGCATCIPIDDPDKMSGGVWVEYLEPIPLTPEILEKNGFKKVFDEDVIIMRNNEISVSVEIGDNYRKYEDGRFYVISIRHRFYYVHQLQHALRLCGIDKEIIL